jgi:hypothetical protein
VRREIVESIRIFDARGGALLLVYSTGSASHLFYETSLRRKVAAVRGRGTLRTKLISGADHVFTQNATQTELLDTIFNWVLGLRTSPESPGGPLDSGVPERFVPASS